MSVGDRASDRAARAARDEPRANRLSCRLVHAMVLRPRPTTLRDLDGPGASQLLPVLDRGEDVAAELVGEPQGPDQQAAVHLFGDAVSGAVRGPAPGLLVPAVNGSWIESQGVCAEELPVAPAAAARSRRLAR